TSELPSDVAAARAQTGESGEAWSWASPLDMKGVYKAEHCLNREWLCGDLRLPWDKAQQFHDELILRIDSHIRRGKAGEHVSTSEYDAGTKMVMTDFYGDSTKYHCGN